MRRTGPVTQKEVSFSRDVQLVTSTNSKGVISFCNDDFCKIAGYSRDELIGQAHNIVRHPDMPSSVFKQMWDDLKSGKPWMGIVKNRCANGDHYWVNAYVMPLVEGNQITGYESVRSAPSREQVERASYVYDRLNRNLSPIPMFKNLWFKHFLSISVFFLSAVSYTVSLFINHDLVPATELIAIISCLVITGFVAMMNKVTYNSVIRDGGNRTFDVITSYIYTGRLDDNGVILASQQDLISRLKAVLGRFRQSARSLNEKSDATLEQVNDTLSAMFEQHKASTHVAELMSQMTIAVQEVTEGVNKTTDSSRVAFSQVKSGEQVISESNEEIVQLSKTVEELSSVLTRLSDDSEKIANVIDVIRSIADQTNLLALNAAIEAARAGEQGRGFSVVADEVRSLAQRTQDSTESIQKIIEQVGKSTEIAVENMESCRTRTQRSVESMKLVGEALNSITASVGDIEQQSQLIATAAEEQSAVATDVNNNAQSISEIALNTEQKAKASAEKTNEIKELSDNFFNLIQRFKMN